MRFKEAFFLPHIQRHAAAVLAEASGRELQLRRPELSFGDGPPIDLVTNHFLLLATQE